MATELRTNQAIEDTRTNVINLAVTVGRLARKVDEIDTRLTRMEGKVDEILRLLKG